MDLKRGSNATQVKQSDLSADKNVRAASKHCSVCKRELYFIDLLHVEELIVHRDCFKCCFCNVHLHFDNYYLDRQFKYNYGLKFFCREHYCLSLSEKINKLRQLNSEPLISRADNVHCYKSTFGNVEKHVLRAFARPARASLSQSESDRNESAKGCTGFCHSRGNTQESDSDVNKNARNLENKALLKNQIQNHPSSNVGGFKRSDPLPSNHVQLQNLIESFDKSILLNTQQANLGSNDGNSNSFGQQMTTFFNELFTVRQEENKENGIVDSSEKPNYLEELVKNSAEDVNQTLYFTPMSALRERNRFQNIEQNNSANYENIGGCLKELKNRITEMKAISGNLEGKIRAGRNNQQLLMNWCHLNEVLKKLETFESEFYAHLRLTNDVEEYKSLRAELQRLLSVGVDDEIELDESAVLEEKCVMEKILRVLEDRDVARKELMKCVESASTQNN